jgi:hypothetical protein
MARRDIGTRRDIGARRDIGTRLSLQQLMMSNPYVVTGGARSVPAG